MSLRKKERPEARKILLGITGERIVASILRKLGHVIEESLDPYDMEKDLLMDGIHRVEVKTQVPFLTEDSFAVGVNQVSKIMESFRVYFVSVPPNTEQNFDEYAGCVFELDTTGEFKAHRRNLQNGRSILCIPRKQAAMRIIHKIEDEKLLETLKELSTSYL
jgi:hypothetical protein